MKKSESKYFNTAVKMNSALISLLKRKPFEYITVSELCRTAGVNRSTFYLHYETVADLLEETTRYLLDDFLSYYSTDTKSVVLNLTACKLDDLVFICDEYLMPYLRYIEDNKNVFLAILSNNSVLGFEKVYERMYDNIFNPILDRFGYPHTCRRYIMQYYLNGINAIILEWLKDDCNKTINELSEIITACIFGIK